MFCVIDGDHVGVGGGEESTGEAVGGGGAGGGAAARRGDVPVLHAGGVRGVRAAAVRGAAGAVAAAVGAGAGAGAGDLALRAAAFVATAGVPRAEVEAVARAVLPSSWPTTSTRRRGRRSVLRRAARRGDAHAPGHGGAVRQGAPRRARGGRLRPRVQPPQAVHRLRQGRRRRRARGRRTRARALRRWQPAGRRDRAVRVGDAILLALLQGTTTYTPCTNTPGTRPNH